MFQQEVRVNGEFLRGTIKKVIEKQELAVTRTVQVPQMRTMAYLFVGNVQAKSNGYTAQDLLKIATESSAIADEIKRLEDADGSQV